MRKKKRSDPSVLTAAIRDAVEQHERASQRLAASVETLEKRMKEEDRPLDELDDSDLEEI